MRISIIGAGIGGLATASGLVRDGHDVTVHERAPRISPIGAGLSLFGNAFAALDALGLGDAVRAIADLVVAADGIGSRTRAGLPGDPGARYSGYSTWRGITDAPVDLHGEAGETWGDGLRFGLAPLADGRVYWFGVATLPENTLFADELAELHRRFDGWHAPIADLIDATEPAAIARHDLHDLAGPLPSFVHGRVALLGDAAHAMTPDLGQGGGQALEDAATLVRLLAATDDVDAALARYDTLRRARTQPIARRSRAVGRIAQLQGGLRTRLRDLAIGLTPTGLLRRQLTALQDWRPPVG
jgi:2-polyprenyl-6-methoxyphenol hydroxylase-like FAD-dependent oxidoreductase